MAQWIKEHGAEYAVPAEIIALLNSGALTDESWHHDACPHFTIETKNRGVWIEHPAPARRENSGWPRFLVIHEGKSLYAGENTQEAIVALFREPVGNEFVRRSHSAIPMKP
jgi:hypothetical protein